PALGIDRGSLEEVEQIIGLPHQILPVERPARPGAGIGLGQAGVAHDGSGCWLPRAIAGPSQRCNFVRVPQRRYQSSTRRTAAADPVITGARWWRLVGLPPNMRRRPVVAPPPAVSTISAMGLPS